MDGHENRWWSLLRGEPDNLDDDIVEMAAELAQMPIAMINVVDDRWQRTRAAVGPERGDLPRDQSYCARVVDSGREVVIADASRDPLCVARDAAAPHRLRFYAGIPLTPPFRFATLCVADYRPRRLAEPALRVLRILAAHTSARWLERLRARDRERNGAAEGGRVEAMAVMRHLTGVTSVAIENIRHEVSWLRGRCGHPTTFAQRAIVDALDALPSLVDRLDASLQWLCDQHGAQIVAASGVAPAIAWTCAYYERHHGMCCRVSYGAEPDSIGISRAVVAWGILVHLLEAAAVHWRAPALDVAIEQLRGPEVLVVRVAARVAPERLEGDIGIDPVRGRVRLLGGDVSLLVRAELVEVAVWLPAA